MQDISSMEEYLERYGPLLGQQAERSLDPLHLPDRHENHPVIDTLLRPPYAPQASVITAGAKALHHQKSLILVGECGTGKTLMGQSILHCHANGRPYRGLVFAPGQLVKKWKRELEETLPDVDVTILSKWKQVHKLWRERPAHDAMLRAMKRPQWYVIGRDTAKLGCKWQPAYIERKVEIETAIPNPMNPEEKILTKVKVVTPFCPSCGRRVCGKSKEGDEGDTIDPEKLKKRKHSCEWCGSPLWQLNRDIDRFEPAKFIHKHLKGFFDYLIVDEIHEEKSPTSAQANAMGALVAASKKCIGMTGTLIGGYAEHIRPMLWRLSPGTLVEAGYRWKDAMSFNEKYGRVEIVIRDNEGPAHSNGMSRGSSRTQTKHFRPGIMPTLFGEHLIGNALFLGLEEMGQELPFLEETVVGVPMDPLLATCYEKLEGDLKDVVGQMLAKRDRRMLGKMLMTLMRYPDFPAHWGNVSIPEMPAIHPTNLSAEDMYEKERALLRICKAEHALGRQVWVYAIFNSDPHDVQSRVADQLRSAGLTVGVLTSNVSPKDREEWIDQHGKNVDVMFSHPTLVQTGLDLFDRGYLGHNFVSLVFYETGYVLPTLRQASRRAWRLRQPQDCKVFYMFYENTMQERAMSLMGKKLTAAEALEGKFSTEGLIAMAGDDGLETAMARSLVENLDESAERNWKVAREPQETIELQEIT